MAGHLTLNPNLGTTLQAIIRSKGLALLWTNGRHVAGGRQSARLLSMEDRPYIVKREKRGGWGGRFLPDGFLVSGPFLHEFGLGLKLSALNLAPEPVAVEFSSRVPPWSVFTLSRALLPSRTLGQLWVDNEMDGAILAEAGASVARLHRERVLHGDLNAGNLLFGQGGSALFLDLRHSGFAAVAPPPVARRRNLTRLGRSLHKLKTVGDLSFPPNIWESLAEGYARGWGETEGWLEGFVSAMDSGFPLRRLIW